MPKAQPFLPRIYSVKLSPDAPISRLETYAEHGGAMGFDHLHIGCCPGARVANDESLAATWDLQLRTLIKACMQKQLKVLIDLDLSSLCSDQAWVQHRPHWFGAQDEDELPDPRRPIKRHPPRTVRYDQPHVVDEVVQYWQQWMQAWVAAGVSGFRCTNVADAPAALWRTLINETKARLTGVCFLAWTPGCSPQQLDALAECGFDATFSSGAWWDYRSHWLADEQARLLRIAPPIAFPDSPDEPVIARLPGHEDLPTRRRLYLRALRLAAVTGHGVLIPIGFEHGVSNQLERSSVGGSADAPLDLRDEIRQANTFIASHGPLLYRAPVRFLSSVGANIALLMRQAAAHLRGTHDDAFLAVINADPQHACTVSEQQLLARADGLICDKRLWPQADRPQDVQSVQLAPAELQLFAARRLPPVVCPPARGKQAVTAAARAPRIAIEAITPSVDGGQFPVKRIVGEVVPIEADVFCDGHDKLAVALLWRHADDTEWHELRMQALGNDRWRATLPLTRIGRMLFVIQAWRDVFATYRDELEKKTTAGLNVSLELEEGRLLVEAAAAHAAEKGLADSAAALTALAKALEAGLSRDKAKAAQKDAARIAALLSEPTAQAMRAADARPFVVRSEPVLRIDVERLAARFSSWYELFPRSQSGDAHRHGTFNDVIARLPAIQAMGFDTLYFPPIHPIGKKHRKGRNNSLTAGPDDPGSPYAIGSEEGGHDAIHPQLGTLADFRRLRDEAARHGLELALDFAIQCSPDHPWLKEHPDWFAWRPDGTLRYAENPPKKYQDIVNVDFYAPGALPGLWIALRDVVLFWVKEGIRVFRVDNPHTKPLPFWEWMIADIRGRYPDTIFLSEAFTRPKMMYRLAKVGYSQSYTYFTWRHTKQEFIDYLTELSTTNVREYFRPHFFVNTPDINPYFLQRCGRPGFLIRAALASTLSGLWGMYSGFELCEGTPVPGKEEYLDSEKYEIRAWDWQRPGHIIDEITQLNRIRSENPALQSHLGIRFLPASNDNILYFIKSTPPADSGARSGDNVILVAINLDPFAAHDASIELPLWEFGLPDDGALEVDDLIHGQRLTWVGKHQPVRFDPFVLPYAIWRVRHQGV